MPSKFSDRQQKRIARRGRSKFSFMFNVSAVELEARTQLYNSLMALLQFDDDLIALKAMLIKFPKFENIEMVSRN